MVVRNESLDSNDPHKYFSYFVPQAVTGGYLAHTLQPVFFLSDSLDTESQAEFTISSKLFAVIAFKSGNPTADKIVNNDNVKLKTIREIHLGCRGDDGSALVVKWDSQRACPVFDKDLEASSARKGRFSITCSASIPCENRYLVGLARGVDNRVRPVAVMPCYPQKVYEFAPKEEIYIERAPFNLTTIGPGVVVSANTREFSLRARVPLHFDGEDIMVREEPTGFSVNNKACDSSTTDGEEPQFWGTATPAPARDVMGQDRNRMHPDLPVREPRSNNYRVDRAEPPPSYSAFDNPPDARGHQDPLDIRYDSERPRPLYTHF